MELTLEGGKPTWVVQAVLRLRQGSEPALLLQLADRQTGAAELLELAAQGRPAVLRSAEGDELTLRIRGGDAQRNLWMASLLTDGLVARLEAASDLWQVFQKRAEPAHDFLRLLLGNLLQNAVDGSWLDEVLGEGICILRPPGLAVGGHAARLTAQLAAALPRVGPLLVWSDDDRPLEIVDLDFARKHPCQLPPGGVFRGEFGAGWGAEAPSVACAFEVQVEAGKRLELIRGLTEKKRVLSAPWAEALKNWRPGALLDGTPQLCRELTVDFGGLAAKRERARVQATFTPWPAPGVVGTARVRLAAHVAQWSEERDHWLESRPAIFSAGPARPWEVAVFDGGGQRASDARLQALVVVPSSRREGQEGFYCRRQENDEVLVEVADFEAPVVLGGFQVHQQAFEERGLDLVIHSARLALITGGLEEGSCNSVISIGSEELRLGTPGKAGIAAAGEMTLTADWLAVQAGRDAVLESGRMAVKAALTVEGEVELGKTLVVTGHGSFKKDADIAGQLQVGAAGGFSGGSAACTADSLKHAFAQSEMQVRRSIEQAGSAVGAAGAALGMAVAAAVAPLEQAASEALSAASQAVDDAQARLTAQIDQAYSELEQTLAEAHGSLEEAAQDLVGAARELQGAVVAAATEMRQIPAAAWEGLRADADACIEKARSAAGDVWKEVQEKAADVSQQATEALADARKAAAQGIADASERAGQAWSARGELLRESLGDELSSVERAFAAVSEIAMRAENLEKTLVAAGQELALEAGSLSAEIEATAGRVAAEVAIDLERCGARVREEAELISGQLRRIREHLSHAVGPAAVADLENRLAALSDSMSTQLDAIPQTLSDLAKKVEDGLAEAARELAQIELADAVAAARETLGAQAGEQGEAILGRLDGELREAGAAIGQRLESARLSLTTAALSIRNMADELARQTDRLPDAAAKLDQKLAALADQIGTMTVAKSSLSQEVGELLAGSRLALARIEVETRSLALKVLGRLQQAAREGQMAASRAERLVEQTEARLGPPPPALPSSPSLPGERSPLAQAGEDIAERRRAAQQQLTQSANATLEGLNRSAEAFLAPFSGPIALPVPLEGPPGLPELQGKYRSLAKTVASEAQLASGKVEAASRLHQTGNQAQIEAIGNKARKLAHELADRWQR